MRRLPPVACSLGVRSTHAARGGPDSNAMGSISVASIRAMTGPTARYRGQPGTDRVELCVAAKRVWIFSIRGSHSLICCSSRLALSSPSEGRPWRSLNSVQRWPNVAHSLLPAEIVPLPFVPSHCRTLHVGSRRSHCAAIGALNCECATLHNLGSVPAERAGFQYRHKCLLLHVLLSIARLPAICPILACTARSADGAEAASPVE